MDASPNVEIVVNRKLTPEEMKERSKMNRMKFYQDLQKVPKMSPGKLIGLVGWSLGMAALDNTIVSVSLPSIQKEPNFIGETNEPIPLSTLQWINDIYAVAFASFAIPAAKIGDRFGQTIVHRWGVIAFVIFSAMCGVSRFIPWNICPWPLGGFYVLIASRLLQGIAAAFNMANSMALCATLVEQKDVPKSMALNSLMFAVAGALGPVLGGLITDFVGWEYNFLINIVIGIIAIVLCWIYLPKTPKFKEDMLDWIGGVIILVGLICLILGFTFIPPEKGNVTLGIIMTIVGVVIVTFFVFWEMHHPFAIVPNQILCNKKIIMSMLAGLFNFMMLTTVAFQMPFCIQTMHCISPSVAGLICLASPIGQMLAAMTASRLSKRVVSVWVKSVSSVFGVGFVLAMGAIIRYDIVWIIIIQFLFSFANGIYFTSNNQFIMQAATSDIRGMIGGCLQAFRETGIAIGIALVNLVQDLYMNLHWVDRAVPIDPTCADPLFQEYRDVYYDGVFMTNVMMSLISVINLTLGLLSGTNEHEKKLLGYPKKLLVQEQTAQAIAEKEEQESLIKDARKEVA